jgi:Na+/phosphate symporter
MSEIVFWGVTIVLSITIVVLVLIILHPHFNFHKKIDSQENLGDSGIIENNANADSVIENCNHNMIRAVISTSKAYFLCFEGFFNGDRQQLKSAIIEAEQFDIMAKRLKGNVFKSLQKLQNEQAETGHFYVQVVDYLREMAHSLNYTVKPIFTYVEKRHKPFDKDQINQFNEFRVELNNFFNYALYILKEKRFEDIDELIGKRNLLVSNLKELEKSHIKRIKGNSTSTRNSILYFNIIAETKSLLLNLINVVKAQRDFINETKSNND